MLKDTLIENIKTALDYTVEPSVTCSNCSNYKKDGKCHVFKPVPFVVSPVGRCTEFNTVEIGERLNG